MGSGIQDPRRDRERPRLGEWQKILETGKNGSERVERRLEAERGTYSHSKGQERRATGAEVRGARKPGQRQEGVKPSEGRARRKEEAARRPAWGR